MNAKEFVNYLKGGIELGQLSELDEKNFNNVFQKLKTVKHEVSEEGNFCSWLQGVMDSSESATINEKKLNLIVEKMGNMNKTQPHYSNDNKNNNENSNGLNTTKLRC